MNAASGSPLPSLRNSISPKHDRIKDNSPSENASAVKATDAVVGMGSPVTSSTDVRSSRKIADTTTVSDSAAFPSKEEPAFQMSLAEVDIYMFHHFFPRCSANILIFGFQLCILFSILIIVVFL